MTQRRAVGEDTRPAEPESLHTDPWRGDKLPLRRRRLRRLVTVTGPRALLPISSRYIAEIQSRYSRSRQELIARMLLQAGAKMEQVGKGGQTNLMAACHFGQ